MNNSSKKEKTVWKKSDIVYGVLIILIILITIFLTKNRNHDNQSTASTSKQSAVARLQQVHDWLDKYGYIFQTFSNNATQTGKDAKNNDNSAVIKDCQKMLADITIAQGFPTIPDTQTASDFSSSLSYYATGAQLCITEWQNMDATLISQYTSANDQGNIKMDAVATDIDNLTLATSVGHITTASLEADALAKKKADEEKVKAEADAKVKAEADKQQKIIDDNAYYTTPAGKICKAHTDWSRTDCDNLANDKVWIGMSINMLVYLRGNPNVANPSNYGYGVNWQYCWYNYTPSCFYTGSDQIIDSYN